MGWAARHCEGVGKDLLADSVDVAPPQTRVVRLSGKRGDSLEARCAPGLFLPPLARLASRLGTDAQHRLSWGGRFWFIVTVSLTN